MFFIQYHETIINIYLIFEYSIYTYYKTSAPVLLVKSWNYNYIVIIYFKFILFYIYVDYAIKIISYR